jgi:hypothetical protein
MDERKREDVVVHTLSIEPKTTEHAFDVDVSRKTWQSCCFECDREVVLYMTKTLMTVSIMAFAMFRITSNTDPCKEQSFEHGLIGMIAGSFIEQGHQRMIKK